MKLIILVAIVTVYLSPSCLGDSRCISEGGHCKFTWYRCDGGSYKQGLCSGSYYRQCCVPKGSSGSSCGSSVKRLACSIKTNSNIKLMRSHVSGVSDRATAYTNIVDTCNGNKAQRSSYGNAPGGSVCLSQSLLQYVLDAANKAGPVQVNELAGASHSKNSRHYRGLAVDFQVKSGDRSYKTWMSMCRSAGARENLGPGDRGHSTHTHCAF